LSTPALFIVSIIEIFGTLKHVFEEKYNGENLKFSNNEFSISILMAASA